MVLHSNRRKEYLRWIFTPSQDFDKKEELKFKCINQMESKLQYFLDTQQTVKGSGDCAMIFYPK